jgi:lysine-N-methylase
MKYTIPHYFEDFKCVAAECEDTCCAGWAIMIDEESLDKYKKLEGAIGNRVRNSVDWEKGSFCQYEGRCAFLNDDNLCDLHIEAGEPMLCNTCRDYPRHMEEFEGVREGSLSLSCIEAAKLILGGAAPVQFLEFEDDVEDEEYEDFDYLLFTKLMDAREKAISLLQNRKLDIKARMAMVLDLAHNMQKALDRQEIFQMDELLESFGTTEWILNFQQKTGDCVMGESEHCSAMRKMFRVFQQLEVLKSDWPEYVKKAEFTLFGEGQRDYEDSLRAFHKSVGVKSQQQEQWSVWLEHLMVYFVFTYFCGAVYDGNILGKMQTSIVSTLLIEELCHAKWKENVGVFHFETFVDIAHRVSREIEHSDINLLRLEKICEKGIIFQTAQLLRVILYQ